MFFEKVNNIGRAGNKGKKYFSSLPTAQNKFVSKSYVQILLWSPSH